MHESDSRAEIDRLCAADGPWLQLLNGGPADVDQLGRLLAERGAVTRVLRGRCMRGRDALFDELGAAVQLPGEPAEDWADLETPLVELELAAGAHVLIVVAASLALTAQPAEFAPFCQLIQSVAQRRAGRPLHVVLVDDAVGLATLRVRLDAAQVDYREVAGWAEQQPPGAGEVPGAAPFEIVTANLEWEFECGSTDPDPVDAALVAAVETDEQVTGLWRCWCHDPHRHPVRVVLAITADPVAADELRRVLVDSLESAGAARCCVEVVAAPDTGEAHGWLRERSVRLWRRKPERARSAPAAEGWEQTVDRRLDDGFTIMGIGPGNALDAGPETSDQVDAEVAHWAERTGHVIAAMRCVATDPKGGQPFPVYGIAIDALTDGAGLPESVAEIVGRHGARRCAVQVFCPFHDLNVFDIQVFQKSRQLWKLERKVTAAECGRTEDSGTVKSTIRSTVDSTAPKLTEDKMSTVDPAGAGDVPQPE